MKKKKTKVNKKRTNQIADWAATGEGKASGYDWNIVEKMKAGAPKKSALKDQQLMPRVVRKRQSEVNKILNSLKKSGSTKLKGIKKINKGAGKK